MVLKFLLVKSVVIPPAKTGKESISNKAVTKTDHTYKGSLKTFIPGNLLLITIEVSS
jgi:hypothetical protein